ncbi:YwmB family TATA-box binding protein [Pelotomaculum propionicicum]|uniref:TATA-box binding protein n=1 Tax=Pelotomaculum propionicicum TaxID=258475 RepID=A0A4Y7RXC6_9FIRM|nr:YwmB family TATA-box binding protein [Pelotomaculum propionicicum]TEB13624.1 hypothetical protein Pmgp_00024 [Pelotomaculum propionicicum]
MLKKELIKRLQSRKKALWVAVGMLIAVSFSVLAFSPACKEFFSSYREEAVLLKIIKSSGAELKSINITGWVRVDDKTAGAFEPETLAGMVAARLNVSETGRKAAGWQNQFARGAKVEGLVKGEHTVSVMGQVMEPRQGETVSHIMVVFDGKTSRTAGNYKSRISSVLDGYGDSRVALTCAGTINNELNKDELLETAERIMTQAGAAVHEKTIKDNLVSLTGFSPKFAEDITYAGKEINLNVALRCDPVEHVTYVYAASPVIYTEY